MAASSVSPELGRPSIFPFSTPPITLVPALIPVELVQEILTWLPAKSLMRFKCVSPIWRSIITDPSFPDAHRGRGGTRGIVVCEPGQKFSRNTCFYFFHFQEGSPTGRLSRYLTVDHGDGQDMACTGIVNGLVCFYFRNHSYLYNVATRETLQLPVSESRPWDYHFGFDPANKLYKLLKICRLSLQCKIITIGVDSSWRTMDSPPPVKIERDGIPLDGVLYWLARTDNNDMDGHYHGLVYHLIAFDLAEERFQSILLPQVNSHGYSLPRLRPGPGPRLALFSMEYDRVSKEVIFGYQNKKSGWMWGERLKFNLPMVDARRYDLDLVGRLHSEKLLMSDPNDCSPPYLLHLFDPTMGVFEKIKIDRTFQSRRNCPHFWGFKHSPLFYYEENIIPLKFLTSCT